MTRHINAFALLLLSHQVLPQAGVFDSTFSTDGWLMNFPFLDAGFNDVVMQPDGRVLAFGHASVPPNASMVMRFTATGAVDSTFGSNGAALHAVAPCGYYPSLVSGLLQPDGKVVIAATSNCQAGEPGFVVRYLLDGQPDTAFADQGTFVVPLSGETYLYDLLAQPDGKLVLFGTHRPHPDSLRRALLVRLTTDGDPDPGFGSAGIVVQQFTGVTWYWGGRVLSDGSLVQCGLGAASPEVTALMKYTASGEVDQSFGTNGLAVTTPVVGAFNVSIERYPDDRILTYTNGTGQGIFARFTPQGAIDPSFCQNGYAIGPDGVANDIALQPDGCILSAGRWTWPHPDSLVAMVEVCRFLPSGYSDPGFGTNGHLRHAVYHQNMNAFGLTLQADGRIVIAGTVNGSYYLARINSGLETSISPIPTATFDPLLYPNPAHDFCTLRYGGSAERLHQVELHDASGRLLRRIAVPRSNSPGLLELPVGDLPPGIYSVLLHATSPVRRLPLVKY